MAKVVVKNNTGEKILELTDEEWVRAELAKKRRENRVTDMLYLDVYLEEVGILEPLLDKSGLTVKLMSDNGITRELTDAYDDEYSITTGRSSRLVERVVLIGDLGLPRDVQEEELEEEDEKEPEEEAEE